jgi:hypothetical protein
MHVSPPFFVFKAVKSRVEKLFLKRERKTSRREMGEIKSELLIARKIDRLFCKYLYRIVYSENHLALLPPRGEFIYSFIKSIQKGRKIEILDTWEDFESCFLQHDLHFSDRNLKMQIM